MRQLELQPGLLQDRSSEGPSIQFLAQKTVNLLHLETSGSSLRIRKEPGGTPQTENGRTTIGPDLKKMAKASMTKVKIDTGLGTRGQQMNTGRIDSSMYLLISFLDPAEPTTLHRGSNVDFQEFQNEHDAIIYAKPHHMDDDQAFVVLNEQGEFGVIPKCDPPYLPELVDKWTDEDLAAFFFSEQRRILAAARQ